MNTQRLNHASVALILLFVTLIVSGVAFQFVQAQGNSQDVEQINQEVEAKKQTIEQINRQIKEYERKIKEKESETVSLRVELEVLENRIAKTQLEIEETNAEIDLVNKEIAILNEEQLKLEAKLEQDRKLIEGILQEMQKNDHSLPLQVFFGSSSFSELFDQVSQLETVGSDLEQTIEQTKVSKALLEEKQLAQEGKRDQLSVLQNGLQLEINSLNDSVGAQETLIVQTKQTEAGFQKMLKQMRQEQQSIDQEISQLQQALESKLSHSDEAGDTSALSWPFNPPKGISTTFHDPTYPFRYMFEHSGLDLPAPKGTLIKSAASGYVAWVKKGQLYGNYVMVIHANGLATLYAHMSRVDVEPDQYLKRGDTIGAVGSTGLSTGPHLHFEVRKNGVPTNPLTYLVAR